MTPASTDRTVAAEWFSAFEGAGLDGVVAKGLDDVYQPDKRALVKVKHQRTADCVVAGFRVHKDGRGVGSLLLGLFDDDERLNHVGVAAGFSTAFRTQLLGEMTPLTENATADHPWGEWARMQPGLDGALGLATPDGEPDDGQRRPGGGSRWNAGKDLSWVPVRAERVVEVTFGQLENGRFRHGVSFVRWRPDRDPASCRYDQLDVALPMPFSEFMDERHHPSGALIRGPAAHPGATPRPRARSRPRMRNGRGPGGVSRSWSGRCWWWSPAAWWWSG